MKTLGLFIIFFPWVFFGGLMFVFLRRVKKYRHRVSKAPLPPRWR